MAAHLATLNARHREDEQAALTAARLFTDYLRACRDERFAMSLLPPGRFLMPGNLAGSPALTFAPLDLPADGVAPEGSLWAMMVRRYEAYKTWWSGRSSAIISRGSTARSFWSMRWRRSMPDPKRCSDLEAALAGILDCFRIGRSTLLSSLFRPRIDRILFAATKADHLHHSSHDRLEAVLRRAVARAATRAEYAGAEIDVVALAAVRATREAQVQRGREKLPSILGTPAAEQTAGGEAFDGTTEVATFPGDLPLDPEQLFGGEGAFRRPLQRRPPTRPISAFCAFGRRCCKAWTRLPPALPHIRLDRALQFLIGDKLQ